MLIKKDFMYGPANSYRTLHIYLPEGYDESEDRYPVMYFFDGHNLFNDSDATYGKSWGLKDFMDGWDKEMIIVGMECSHEGNGRMDEYSPYPGFWGDFMHLTPMGDETMKWIVNEIKPWVDKEFRTYSFREATGIGGSSMGGLMALYGLVAYNEVFSKGACVSSAVIFCMRRLMNLIRRKGVDPDTRAFLSWGTREARARSHNKPDVHSPTYYRNKKLGDALSKCGAEVLLYSQPGGHHCEADWEKQNPLYMDWLWKC